MGLGGSLRAPAPGPACLRRFETVERRGMEARASGTGHWWRWNGAKWNRLELAKSVPVPADQKMTRLTKRCCRRLLPCSKRCHRGRLRVAAYSRTGFYPRERLDEPGANHGGAFDVRAGGVAAPLPDKMDHSLRSRASRCVLCRSTPDCSPGYRSPDLCGATRGCGSSSRMGDVDRKFERERAVVLHAIEVPTEAFHERTKAALNSVRRPFFGTLKGNGYPSRIDNFDPFVFSPNGPTIFNLCFQRFEFLTCPSAALFHLFDCIEARQFCGFLGTIRPLSTFLVDAQAKTILGHIFRIYHDVKITSLEPRMPLARRLPLPCQPFRPARRPVPQFSLPHLGRCVIIRHPFRTDASHTQLPIKPGVGHSMHEPNAFFTAHFADSVICFFRCLAIDSNIFDTLARPAFMRDARHVPKTAHG